MRGRTGYASLALVLVAAGCGGEPPPPTAADVTGVWCGPERDVLTLDADGGFTVTDISVPLVDEVLYDEDFVAGYRRETEHGGAVPRHGAGRWRVFVDRGDMFQARRDHVVLDWATFESIRVSEKLELTIAGEGTGLVLGVERVGSGFTTLFARCPAA
ncbi:hypothetical protein ACGF5C_09750 [Micromonospora sp. NPDC047620]|uniref:hypothetical protein n=1 Tax=Micromonospora sp. NPDC047620 TaxID=3364251 RepID=UPI003717E736